MSDNNDKAYITEPDKEDSDIIKEYTESDKIRDDFLPFTTYDLVQSGYPQPNCGKLIGRAWGGTDADGKLMKSNGMWCRVSEVEYYYRLSELQSKLIKAMSAANNYQEGTRKHTQHLEKVEYFESCIAELMGG